jgi:hypothetical protein
MRLKSLARWAAALVLLLVASGAFALGLSPEFPVSEVVLQPAGLLQEGAVVASDGTDFLGVWVDDRPAPVDGRIRYSLIGGNGAVVTPIGIPIPGTLQNVPKAAFWTGTEYVVFVGGAGGAGAIRIDRNGLLVQTAIGITADGMTIQNVASNGSTFIVLFAPRTGDTTSLAAVVLDTSLRNSREIGLPAPASDALVADIVANDSEYGVVWGTRATPTGPWTLRTVRLDSDGDLLDPLPIALDPFDSLVFPRIASTDDGYLVTAGEALSTGSSTYVIPLDDAARPTSARRFVSDGLSTGVIATDEEYLVPVFDSASGSTSDIRVFRVGPNGVTLSSSTLTAAAGYQGLTSSARRSDRVLFAWNDGRRRNGEPSDVYFAFTDFAGIPLGEATAGGISMAYSAPDQASPAIAFDGNNYLVAWIQIPEENVFHLYAGRVSRQGVPLDGGGFRVYETLAPQFAPEVTFDGTNFVVLWREGTTFASKLFAARIAPDGTVLGVAPIEVGDISSGSSYAIASNGDGSAIVFGGVPSAGVDQIRLARLPREGSIIDRGGRIIHSLTGNPLLDIATDGRDYVVVWSAFQSAVSSMQILADGSTSAPIGISAIGFDPVIAWGGGRYLVGFSVIAGPTQHIRGRLLDTRGAPVGTERLLAARSFSALGNVRTRDLTYDGARFSLAWADPVAFGPPPTGGLPEPIPDVRARQITREGIALSTDEGLLISGTPEEDAEPAITGGLLDSGIVYRRVAPDQTGVERLFMRILTSEGTRTRPARR